MTIEHEAKFRLTGRQLAGTHEIASVSYANLVQEIRPGAKILLADGLIELQVEKIDGDDIVTTVLNSGEVSNNKRVAVPGICINLPPVSDQDAADINFGIAQGMDFIAASFIQQASDVLAIRKVLEDAGSDMAQGLHELLARLCTTRPLRAGSILCAAPVRNQDTRKGQCSLADRRALEQQRDGQISTPWLQPGDVWRAEARSRQGSVLFGALQHEVAFTKDIDLS